MMTTSKACSLITITSRRSEWQRAELAAAGNGQLLHVLLAGKCAAGQQFVEQAAIDRGILDPVHRRLVAPDGDGAPLAVIMGENAGETAIVVAEERLQPVVAEGGEVIEPAGRVTRTPVPEDRKSTRLNSSH